MGRGTIVNQKSVRPARPIGPSACEEGWSLVELTVSLFLLMAIALFGMQTMVSGFLLQNWSIGQTMTDACAGIETAYAQREVFANIPTNGRWGIYPAAITTAGVVIGQTPFQQVKATLTRTYHVYTLDPVTGALSYLLETYVVYTSGQRTYCKVSKVFRSQ
jgi:hypothetical protein